MFFPFLCIFKNVPKNLELNETAVHRSFIERSEKKGKKFVEITGHTALCELSPNDSAYKVFNKFQPIGWQCQVETHMDRVFLRLSHLFHGYPQFYDCAGLRTVRRYGTMPAGGKKWKINGKSEGESLYFSDKIIVITLKRKVYGKFYRCIYIIMFHILNGFLR